MKKIIPLLYLISFIFFALTIKKCSDLSKRQKFYLETNEKFDLNEFINSKSYSTKHDIIKKDKNIVIAIYLTSTNACSICLNEIISYSKFIEKSNFLGLPVLQIVVVIDKIPKRAIRFVKTAEFILPVIWGSDNKYKTVLQKYGNKTETQQLILYHDKLKVIFFRTILSKIPTSERFKNTILKKAQNKLLADFKRRKEK